MKIFILADAWECSPGFLSVLDLFLLRFNIIKSRIIIKTGFNPDITGT